MYLRGVPFFGGAGLYPDGSLNMNTGNIQNEQFRQDIYIAGYGNADDTDKSAASLEINGDIGSGDGTIWVWAAEARTPPAR